MALRTLFVPLDGSETARAALELALMVGRDFSAHVDVLHVRADPKNALPLLGEGMSGAMIEEMIELADKEGKERATTARRQFDAAVGRFGIPLADRAPGPSAVSAAWRQLIGREDDEVARMGRLHDLIVVGRPAGNGEVAADLALNAALFDSGRPVLVAPPEVPASVGRRVVIGWKGGPEAARAVAGALPFLARAEAVYVLTADVEDEESGPEAGDLAAYLAWHGITASAQSFSPGGQAVGSALLAECGHVGADLLVMGSYSHSRVWEAILGGVTRHVLEGAGLPILMAH